jgi:hypothetical protein
MYRVYRNPLLGGWVFERIAQPSKSMFQEQEETFFESVVEQARTLTSNDAEDLEEEVEAMTEKEEKEPEPKKNSREAPVRSKAQIKSKDFDKKEVKKKVLACSKLSSALKVPISMMGIQELIEKSHNFAA